MADDSLEFRTKIVMVEADELIYRLSRVEDFFEEAISKLKHYEWDSDYLRPDLERAEAKAVETGDYDALIRGYRNLARAHLDLALWWSSGSVTSPDTTKYHRKLAEKYNNIAEARLKSKK